MKRFYLFLALSLIALGMAACTQDKESSNPPVAYNPGEIPGLGDAEGELTGSPFVLPKGVELVGDITGGGAQYYYWQTEEDYSPAGHAFVEKDGTVTTRAFFPAQSEEEYIPCYGSGYGYVDLLVSLKNTNSSPTTVTFPAALILRNLGGDCQNGVLLKRTDVVLPAQTTQTICLLLYCGNSGKGSAYGEAEYVWGVVSNAAPLLDLCERVKDRRINIEEFDPRLEEDYYIYSEQVSRLQDIVWEVTDYEGLGEASIEYLNALPKSK